MTRSSGRSRLDSAVSHRQIEPTAQPSPARLRITQLCTWPRLSTVAARTQWRPPALGTAQHIRTARANERAYSPILYFRPCTQVPQYLFSVLPSCTDCNFVDTCITLHGIVPTLPSFLVDPYSTGHRPQETLHGRYSSAHQDLPDTRVWSLLRYNTTIPPSTSKPSLAVSLPRYGTPGRSVFTIYTTASHHLRLHIQTALYPVYTTSLCISIPRHTST